MEAKMKGDQTPWVLCQCDDYWCQVHQQHTSECPCPGIDWWAERDLDPYDDVTEEVFQELKEMEPEQEIGS
jgi:hypothetical protein